MQRSSLIRVFTVYYSICIFLTKYPKVWPLCLNFKVKFSCVVKFRNFTVMPPKDAEGNGNRGDPDQIWVCTVCLDLSVMKNLENYGTNVSND